MSKQKLYLDFDSTICNSAKAYCDTYNFLYKGLPDFVPADHTKNQHWDFHEVAPLVENPMSIFNHPFFFEKAEFMLDAEEVIKKLCEKYQVIICSIGTYDNISLKSQFIKTQMPYIQDAILLINQGCKMDKSSVNMEDGHSIFIDDVASNLYSSDAETCILFGERYPWNSGWIWDHCLTWLDVAKELL